ncbi:MAG TPA: DUF1428 family protein [Solirubrobacteraceae bacterium]|jgi:uncharacterized protein YbaA (DUF1428 family)
MPSSAPYVDLYLLPVPRANLEAYRSQAVAFGAVAREHGALSYREFLADDPGENLTVEDGVVMTAAVVEFTSREHRDTVMHLTMSDPRVEALGDVPQPADMSRMSYGGFAPLVTA